VAKMAKVTGDVAGLAVAQVAVARVRAVAMQAAALTEVVRIARMEMEVVTVVAMGPVRRGSSEEEVARGGMVGVVVVEQP